MAEEASDGKGPYIRCHDERLFLLTGVSLEPLLPFPTLERASSYVMRECLPAAGTKLSLKGSFYAQSTKQSGLDLLLRRYWFA